LFPLVAIIAYIPLMVTTASSRPWRMQHRLFMLFLIAAMMWSLADFFFRSNLFPNYSPFLFKSVVIIFSWMAIQYHCFTSSFFPPNRSRWLPFAYASLVGIIVLVIQGYVTQEVIAGGDKLYPKYSIGVLFVVFPIITLLGRNLRVLWGRLKTLDNPMQYNQIVSLLVGLSVLTVFTSATFIPQMSAIPIGHFGNLINALILSYATMRHQLVDIRFVLRRGLTWVSLGVVGAVCYWLLLVMLHTLLRLELNLTTTFVATIVAILVAIIVFKLRGLLFVTVSRALGGPSYDYRQRLSDFASTIHNVFSLREQGGELLTLVTQAVGCRKAGLLFLDDYNKAFTAQLVEPDVYDNPLSSLRLRHDSPIANYLGREQRPLSRRNFSTVPVLLSLWQQEEAEIESNEIELFVPLVSRDRLIGILVLDKKKTGRYSLGDFNLLEDVTRRVAVSMEKEYLREQLREREEELEVINRSSVIISSSLNIHRIFDSFIEELKKAVEISWAAIALIEKNDLYILALSSEIGSAWQVGERIPIKGTATKWVATHRKAIVESDLSQEIRFATGEYHLRQGVRSIAYLPLIAKGEVIGSLIMASRHPNAYSQRHIRLLEQLASQVAMPVENSRLYAKAEERARIDELTGLLNRRSLDELLASEIGRHSRYGGTFSIVVLDLDSFKAFNDSYGHLAGDKLLRQIGNIISASVRSADQAFRYGGDEFAILLPQTSTDAAYQVAERVRQQIASGAKAGHIPVTASLGLANWPSDGLGLNELITAADMALYHAKRSGGNQGFIASRIPLPLAYGETDSESDVDSEILNTIYALAGAVDARDHYTRSHSKKVNAYTIALAEALNLEPEQVIRLGTCALLHDIGKIGISDKILNNPGKLSAEDWEAIKIHPQLGATIASHACHLASCVPVILHHHERHDGSGYPKGLKGKEIPLEARILSIADAFAAMTSKRHYSDALSLEDALEEIERGAGTQFDPGLVEVFLRIMRTTPIATKKQK